LHKKNEKGQFINRVIADEEAGNSLAKPRKIASKNLTGTVILNKMRQALRNSVNCNIDDTKLQERIA
jgi:hypothetical protein